HHHKPTRGQALEHLRELVYGDATSATDVEGSGNTSAFSSSDVRLYYVAHVDEIPRLLAIAENGERLSTEHPENEDRDNISVRVVSLIWPKDVEVPKTYRFKAVEPSVGQPEFLLTELAAPIRRIRFHGMVFPNRKCFQLAEASS